MFWWNFIFSEVKRETTHLSFWTIEEVGCLFSVSLSYTLLPHPPISLFSTIRKFKLVFIHTSNRKLNWVNAPPEFPLSYVMERLLLLNNRKLTLDVITNYNFSLSRSSSLEPRVIIWLSYEWNCDFKIWTREITLAFSIDILIEAAAAVQMILLILTRWRQCRSGMESVVRVSIFVRWWMNLVMMIH